MTNSTDNFLEHKSFKKGDLVMIDPGDKGAIAPITGRALVGWTITTSAERKEFYDRCKREGTMLDSAGEPVLASDTRRSWMDLDRVYIVLRARTRHSSIRKKNMCLVLCPKTGKEIYVCRDRLRVVT